MISLAEEKRLKVNLALICVTFGTIGVVTHFIPLSSAAIVFYRALIGGIFIILYSLLFGKGVNIKSMKDNLIVLIGTSFFMDLNWVFQFEAFRVSSVAIGTVCYNTMPIFLIMIASFMFNEKITLKSVICILMAMVGIFLVSNIINTGIKSSEVLGCIYGILGAIFYALIVAYNRKLEQIDVCDKIIFQFLFSTIIMAVYVLFIAKGSLFFEKGISEREAHIGIFCILLLGLFHTGFCYIHYFIVVSKLKSETVAIYTYIDPVVALFLSYFVLHENMTVLQFIGAILILSSTLFNELSKKFNK